MKSLRFKHTQMALTMTEVSPSEELRILTNWYEKTAWAWSGKKSKQNKRKTLYRTGHPESQGPDEKCKFMNHGGDSR